MADLRLISLLPPQAVSGVPQSQASPGAASQGNAVLSSLAPGTVLSGFIVNRDASGNPVLRTTSGDVTFASNFFLRIGSEVTIRIENTPAAGTLAHILSVDGQPPEIAETLSGFAAAPEVIISNNLTQNFTAAQSAITPQEAQAAAQTAVQPSTAPAPATITVTGMIISPPPSSSTQPALPVGTQLTMNVTTLSITAEPSTAVAVPTSPTVAAPLASPASYSAYARASGTPSVLTPATTPSLPAMPAIPAEPSANVIIPAVAPLISPAEKATPTNVILVPATTAPAAPSLSTAIESTPAIPATISPAATVLTQPSAAAPAAPQAGQNVVAIVIGNEPTGEAVLQSSAGIIRLQPGTTLPAGSQVTFEVTQITMPTAPAAATAAPAPLTGLARQWGSLQQIAALLTGSDPEANTITIPALSAAIPWLPAAGATLSPTTEMPQTISAGLMLFLTALRAGDFRNWLGKDNVRWLEDEGHSALVAKAEGEFTGMARQYADTPPGHWQPLFFPVAVEGMLQQARLYVKRDRKDSHSRQGKKNEDTRFVVEVDLTQLGEMQMDGFVRVREQHTQFDLIIRSHTALPQEVQQTILQIYTDTGELTGYKGSLQFQAVREFPVKPLEEIVAHAMKSVVA